MVKHYNTASRKRFKASCLISMEELKERFGKILVDKDQSTKLPKKNQTSEPPKKDQISEPAQKDRISELSDDILISILTYMNMKEAGKTSVLSKRWRHVWAFIPILNLGIGRRGINVVDNGEERYLHWVDQVLSLHKAPAIDVFNIYFKLGESTKNYVDNCIRFAMVKKVKRLYLSNQYPAINSEWFPYDMSMLSSYDSLQSLELYYIDVTGELLESVVHNCQGLEFISVTGSKSLVELKIAGALNLKALRLCNCQELKLLEISAPKFMSFILWAISINFPFKNTPKLTKLSICGSALKSMMHDISDSSSSCISQIEALTLRLYNRLDVINLLPSFTRLKMLNVEYSFWSGKDLLGFRSLLKACPLLHDFILQLHSYDYGIIRRRKRVKSSKRKRGPFPHYNLKLFHIVGFGGPDGDLGLGFVKYIIKNVISLERIIVDPHHPWDVNLEDPAKVGTIWEYNGAGEIKNSIKRYSKDDELKRARNMANQLRVNLKPGIELVIR